DEAAGDDVGGPLPLDRRAVEADGTAPGAQHAGDGAVEGGLAGAVRAQHGDDFPRPDAEIDAAQNFGGAVAGAQAMDREQRLSHDPPPPPPPPPPPSAAPRRGR